LNRKRKFRDVKKGLRSTPDNPYRIIAELKRKSPSRGVIRDPFPWREIAQIYNRTADAISILTEPHFFGGSLDYLAEIDKFAQIPLLRKDFIIDPFQIAEAYYYGADFILLIVKALSPKKLEELYRFAKKVGLEALVEVHSPEEAKIAVDIGAEIIGFNHRNLETFQMEMDLGERIIPLLPKGTVVVAESGIDSPETIKRLHEMGVDAFLIGEHLMRQRDIAARIAQLKGRG
jgi:indole-3-glycerol phosphate synthase